MFFLAHWQKNSFPAFCPSFPRFTLIMYQPGFEPGTNGLEDRCSIQLSYWYKSLLSIREPG